MRHQLSLEVPVIFNPKVLRIEDTSIYTSALPVECSRLEITVPGFVAPVAIEVSEGYIMNLSSCHLGLQTVGCADDTLSLPDGIYVIRYSVSPNDKVFVEYNHLRMTQAMNLYYTKMCAMGLGTCEPDQDTKAQLRKFQLVRAYMEAAKAKVEYCHEPHKGMELFLYAQRMMGKILMCDRVIS